MRISEPNLFRSYSEMKEESAAINIANKNPAWLKTGDLFWQTSILLSIFSEYAGIQLPVQLSESLIPVHWSKQRWSHRFSWVLSLPRSTDCKDVTVMTNCITNTWWFHSWRKNCSEALQWEKVTVLNEAEFHDCFNYTEISKSAACLEWHSTLKETSVVLQRELESFYQIGRTNIWNGLNNRVMRNYQCDKDF